MLVATFSAMLFFYAGGESAIGGWVAEHVRRIEGTGAGRQWTIAPMVFWAALALGRLAHAARASRGSTSRACSSPR